LKVLVVDAVLRNRSPLPNSRLSRNLTGNIAKFDTFGRGSIWKQALSQQLVSYFPKKANREFFDLKREGAFEKPESCAGSRAELAQPL
jgi:hypothetical protein